MRILSSVLVLVLFVGCSTPPAAHDDLWTEVKQLTKQVSDLKLQIELNRISNDTNSKLVKLGIESDQIQNDLIDINSNSIKRLEQ